MPTIEQVLDEILPSLADNFEAGKGNYVNVTQPSVEYFEPTRECLAALIAEDSIEYTGMGLCKFTAKGYAKYRARVSALRALGR